mgnify:CR=1 FL=1
MNFKLLQRLNMVAILHKDQFSQPIQAQELKVLLENACKQNIEHPEQVNDAWISLCEKRQFEGKSFDQMRKEYSFN